MIDMKYFKQHIALLTFATCILTNSLGQDQLIFPTNDDGIVEYSEIVQAPELSEGQLYDKCLIWFAEQFKSANEVIQYQNKENSTIIAKGAFIEESYNLLWRFTLKIECKDGRFRYILNNIYQDYNNGETTF